VACTPLAAPSLYPLFSPGHRRAPLVYRAEEATDEPEPGGSVGKLDEPLGRRADRPVQYRDLDDPTAWDSARSLMEGRMAASDREGPYDPRPTFLPRASGTRIPR
jgi:hypothetical protein